MKKLIKGIFPVLIITLIISCNGNPFMTNLFSEIDQYQLPTSFSSADDILDAATDDQFLDALSNDPELADIVITTLEEEIAATPATSATTDDQEAALLLADVYLATTNADDTINNVNDLLVDAISDPAALDFASPETVIEGLFSLDPAMSPAEQETYVSDQLAAFLGAADALTYYGETMTDGSLETNPEVNVGETAATAMISGMTSYMIDNMDTATIDPVLLAANPAATDEELAIIAMTDSIVNGTPMPAMLPDPAVDDAATTEDMLNAMLGGGLAEVVNDGFDLSAFESM